MMTDVWKGSSENENDNSCDSDDQQELEFYLYSLVHHDTSVGEEITRGHVEEITPSAQENAPGPQRGWRYFNRDSNVTPYQNRNERFSKRLEDLRDCNTVRGRGRALLKNPYWKRREPAVVNWIEAMNNLRNKTSRHAPVSANTRSSPNVDIVTISDVQGTASQMDDSEKQCTSMSSPICISPETPCCPSSKDDKSQEEDKSNQSTGNSRKENILLSTEENEDLNNANRSLSSLDDCFEPPQTSFSKPKSKSSQNLNECMTQVLGSMIDEDASRSSIESDKRPVQKPSRNSNNTDWTVGMSWEDMSSKFRFNFEVDSVCGDSVREGSISSSRANTPDPAVEISLEPKSPDDVSKYDVSLKTKENASDSMVVNENSDSDVESVVEVTQPVKEPPPVVEILSDSEDVIPSKIIKLDEHPIVIEEDIVIVYETAKPASNRVVSIPEAMTPSIRDTSVGASSKKRERQRKRAKRQAEASSSGEIADILAGMSADPSLWRLCRDDIYPRPSPRKFRPCDNCKQRDHNTWHCPEPEKIKVCTLCAQPGHNHYRCPQRMCLSCGAKAPSFVRRCHQCIRNNQICNICKWTGHNSRQCPDLWRRYHSTTSAGPPVAPADPSVAPAAEMWCCNCARKGHYSHDCAMSCSPINEKILSNVVSYADPTRGDKSQPPETPGKSGVDTPRIQPAKSTVSQNLESAKQSSSANSPSVVTRKEKKSRAAPSSTVPRADFYNNPIFQVNYPILMSKVKSVAPLPSQADALADFLEAQLELIKTPFLKGNEVQRTYIKLMAIMKRVRFHKRTVRKAYQFAARLNMTLIGYGGLGNGEDHVRELRKRITSLRQRKGKVPMDLRALINDDFQYIFKGFIRNDLNSLITEYLERERLLPT